MRRFVLLGLFGLAQLSALGGCGDFGASVDYLYWKPANFAGDFGTISREGEGGKTLKSLAVIDPTYHSGVRGEITWRPECTPLAFIGRYYWVESRQHKTFSVPPSSGEVESISASMEGIYHAADLLAAYQFCICSRFELDFLVAGHVLYMAANSKGRVVTAGASQTIVTTETHGRLAGGGGSVGFACAFDIWCGLEAFGELSLGAIFGSDLLAEVETTTGLAPSTVVTAPRSFQTWTRELDVRLGGRYSRRCGCGSLGVELGWEARTYPDFVSLSTTIGGSESVGGPFIGLTGSF